MAITWRNVNAPDVGGAAYAAGQAANSFSRGFDSLNDLFEDVRDNENANWNNQKQLNTEDMIAQLQGMTQAGDVDGLKQLENDYMVGAIRDRFGAQADATKISEIYQNSVNKAESTAMDKLLTPLFKAGGTERDIINAVKGSSEFANMDLLEQQAVLGSIGTKYAAFNGMTQQEYAAAQLQNEIQQVRLDHEQEVLDQELAQKRSMFPTTVFTGDMQTRLDDNSSAMDILHEKAPEYWNLLEWIGTSRDGADAVEAVYEKVDEEINAYNAAYPDAPLKASPDYIRKAVALNIVANNDKQVTPEGLSAAIKRTFGMMANAATNEAEMLDYMDKYNKASLSIKERRARAGHNANKRVTTK